MVEDEGPDVYDRKYVPVRDALTGKTDADNYRHMIVRSEFLKRFWQDDKVQALVVVGPISPDWRIEHGVCR